VSFGKTVTQYLRDEQKGLEVANEYATSHTEREQRSYQKYHNLRSADEHFVVDEAVLVLIPDTTASKLFSKWSGPATVVAQRSPYSYQVELNDVRRHYHANQLRKFHVRVESVCFDARVYDFSADSVRVSNDNSYECSVDSCAVGVGVPRRRSYRRQA